jgi:23S rRNA (pseudouridine1915-N3)-methyltransferase
MRITLIVVGKIKEKYLQAGINEYLKRLRPYAQVEIIEVGDEPAPEKASPAQEEQIKEREAEKIAKHIKEKSFIVALALEGKMLGSVDLAEKLQALALKGQSHITFLIGGSLGLAKSLTDQADFLLSLSPMTFPHQLVRLIFLEQIYRAFKIIKGEPYHK